MILVFHSWFLSFRFLVLEKIFRCIAYFNRQDMWFTVVYLLRFAYHLVSPEVSEKKVPALISKLGDSTVLCIIRMLAYKPHYSVYFFVCQQLKYQIFSFKKYTPVNPLLECGQLHLRSSAREHIGMHSSYPSIPPLAIIHLLQH